MFAVYFDSYIFAIKIGRRGSDGVPQRDIGIVVWPVSRFFVLYGIIINKDGKQIGKSGDRIAHL